MRALLVLGVIEFFSSIFEKLISDSCNDANESPPLRQHCDTITQTDDIIIVLFRQGTICYNCWIVHSFQTAVRQSPLSWLSPDASRTPAESTGRRWQAYRTAMIDRVTLRFMSQKSIEVDNRRMDGESDEAWRARMIALVFKHPAWAYDPTRDRPLYDPGLAPLPGWRRCLTMIRAIWMGILCGGFLGVVVYIMSGSYALAAVAFVLVFVLSVRGGKKRATRRGFCC